MAEETPTYPAVDLDAPQLTIRAVATGMILGGTLSLCNVYLGLKIGWGINMSITAALLGFGFWQFLKGTAGTSDFGKLENNVNQTAASSAASISSAGLVAPIPALTLMTGYEMSYIELVLWTLSVSLVGVVVAIGLRRQMLIVDNLPYPGGIAAGETLKEIYAKGKEAMARVKMLVLGIGIGAALKFAIKFLSIPKVAIPGAIGKYSFKNLTFLLDPSPLFVAMGALIGLKAAISMFLGAVIAFIIIGPAILDAGWVNFGAKGANPDGVWFKPMVTWLLWPGVAMMVTASLTSFGFSWRSVLGAITGTKQSIGAEAVKEDVVPRNIFLSLIAGALVASVCFQFYFFGIGWGLASFGVFLTFLLAIVAARVSGETGITPVGAMGKVTQLTFGGLAGSNVSNEVIAASNASVAAGGAAHGAVMEAATASLMPANVTGGAASQCADLLHDMKAGLLVGASPRLQTYAQFFGVVSGAIFGSLAYMILVGDAENLRRLDENPDWALVAVVQWKAVAEVFMQGFENLPTGAMAAMMWAGGLGIVLAVMEKIFPKKLAMWVPSATGIGIAFCIPAWIGISSAFGALIAWYLTKRIESWSKKFLIVLAAGLIAGESLAGAALAVLETISG